MKTLAVGEFKAHFSSVLKEVQDGHPVTITYGKKRAKLAVVVPYHQYMKSEKRKIGILKNKATFHIHDDFNMSEEEFLSS